MTQCPPHENAPLHAGDGEIPEGATRFPCLCNAGASVQATDEVRWLESFHDMDFPPVPFPSRRIHEVAGEKKLRELVRLHHIRLKDTEIGHLFPKSMRRFAAGIEKTADFVIEACGGSVSFTPRHGPMRMRERHFAFDIDERAREIWLLELLRAFDDVGFPEALREEYWNWVEPFSIRMINRRTTKEQPRRHPWAGAKVSLEQATNAVRA